jgi:hypothetical protein
MLRRRKSSYIEYDRDRSGNASDALTTWDVNVDSVADANHVSVYLLYARSSWAQQRDEEDVHSGGRSTVAGGSRWWEVHGRETG